MGVDLEKVDDAAEFLGVDFELDIKTVLIDMKYNGIIKCVIESVELDYGMPKGNFMSSEANPLVKDNDGER